MPPAPPKERLLIVDDAPDTREVLQRNLTTQGYHVFTATGVAEAVKILESSPVDLVITDLKMPGASGMDLVRHVRENLKETEVMMITGYPSIEGAIQAVKDGAEEYLPKPFTQGELLSAVKRTLDKLHLKRAGRSAEKKISPTLFGLAGESEPMKRVLDAAQKAAGSSATVLISGESGTGKELVARAIHYRSPRAAFPFVPVSCGGIPEELLESELFGHLRGSFSGATETRTGFFQIAEGGTIFLDDVSAMSPAMQARLLRVLQDKQVGMIGSTRIRAVDVRVISGTRVDLYRLVEKGAFREDLFYRLGAISIALPPLRDRDADSLILANQFAAKFAKEVGKPCPKFSDQALTILRSYSWPGNIRELENLVHHLVLSSPSGVIEIPDLPALMRFSALREANLNRTLADVEREYIRNVLANVGGNKTRAAEILGIDRKTLREKLKSQTVESS